MWEWLRNKLNIKSKKDLQLKHTRRGIELTQNKNKINIKSKPGERHAGRPRIHHSGTDTIHIIVNKGLKKRYQEYCHSRHYSVSNRLEGHIRNDLVEAENLSHQQFIAIRLKPKRRKEPL